MIEARMIDRKLRLLPPLIALATLALLGCDASKSASPTPSVADNGSAESAKELADASAAVEVLLAKDRVAEAEVVARALAKRYPSDAGASELFARVVGIRALRDDARAGDPSLEEASAAAQRASELSPTDATRAQAAALLLDRAGKRDAARVCWKRVATIALATNDTRFTVAAAIALAAHQDPESAAALVLQLKQLGEGNAVLASTRAQIALASGNPNSALADAREAFTSDASSLEYRLLYARVLRLCASSNDAALLLAALPEASLANPAVAEELALALSAQERFSQAAQAWRRTRVHGVNARRLAEEALARIAAQELSLAAQVLEELRVAPHAEQETHRVEHALRTAAKE